MNISAITPLSNRLAYTTLNKRNANKINNNVSFKAYYEVTFPRSDNQDVIEKQERFRKNGCLYPVSCCPTDSNPTRLVVNALDEKDDEWYPSFFLKENGIKVREIEPPERSDNISERIERMCKYHLLVPHMISDYLDMDGREIINKLQKLQPEFIKELDDTDLESLIRHILIGIHNEQRYTIDDLSYLVKSVNENFDIDLFKDLGRNFLERCLWRGSKLNGTDIRKACTNLTNLLKEKSSNVIIRTRSNSRGLATINLKLFRGTSAENYYKGLLN